MGGAETKEQSPASPSSVQGRLEAAAQSGDAATIRKLITEGGKSSACVGGRIPLHLACARAAFRSDATYLEELLADPSVDVNAIDESGGTPLHMTLRASKHTHPRHEANVLLAVRVLLRAGAQVNARNKRGETPLHYAAYVGKKVVDELLVAGADANALSANGSNALAYAIHMDVMRTLLAAGASPNAKSNNAGWSGKYSHLIVAATFVPERFDLLLDAGADTTPLLDCWRDFSTSILSVASASVLRKLVALGVDLNARNNQGRTVLFCQRITPEVMHILLDAGIGVNAQDERGLTALRYHVECVATGVPPFPLVDALLDAGADLTIKACDGCTPLDVARQSGNHALCRCLLARSECVKLP